MCVFCFCKDANSKDKLYKIWSTSQSIIQMQQETKQPTNNKTKHYKFNKACEQKNITYNNFIKTNERKKRKLKQKILPHLHTGHEVERTEMGKKKLLKIRNMLNN